METSKYLQLQVKFSEFYVQQVQPKLESYNNKRKELLETYIRILIALLIPLIITFWCEPGFLIVGIPFIVLILFFVIFYFRKFSSEPDAIMKNDLMNGFVKIFGDLYWYYGSRFDIEAKELDNIKKLNLFNALAISFDDCIEGKYEDVPFAIREVSIKPPGIALAVILPAVLFVFCPFLLIPLIVALLFLIFGLFNFGDMYSLLIMNLAKSGMPPFISALIPATILVLSIKAIWGFVARKIKSLTTGFKGVIVEFEMNKDFEGHTFILDNTKEGKSIIINKNKYSEVKLEDIEFLEKYTIWSDNQIEARYLLTTAFVERLKNLKTTFNAKFIRVSFKDKKIVIAIHTGYDMFKMSDMFSKTGKETFVKLFNEILSVLEFIEHLKLNKKLGL